MTTPKTLTKNDLMSLDDYAAVRDELRRANVALKKPRRIAVGPDATFYFENHATMKQQVLEMLYIEKGGDEQVEDELQAYNPMIPQGQELTATLMFEINDEVRRGHVLRQLTDVELTAYVQLGDDKVFAKPEQEVERTAPDGKTSSVHFLHFQFPAELIAKFAAPDTQIVLGFGHENYTHMTVLTAASKASLFADFDA